MIIVYEDRIFLAAYRFYTDRKLDICSFLGNGLMVCLFINLTLIPMIQKIRE